ncbi:MAG: hypothetical protein WBI40_10910, partial [Methylococcaceae bacterium]
MNTYNDDTNTNNDQFSYLKAIASGEVQAPALASDVRFWSHEDFQPLIGKILGFDGFEHPSYGKQETVIVEREDGEVVSAILTMYLQKGMELQDGQIGDAILIEK